MVDTSLYAFVCDGNASSWCVADSSAFGPTRAITVVVKHNLSTEAKGIQSSTAETNLTLAP